MSTFTMRGTLVIRLAPAQFIRSRDELRRYAGRIVALERQAEALLDAIHSQLPYSLHATPLQEAVPLESESEESG